MFKDSPIISNNYNVYYFIIPESEGKALESEMNAAGPGEALFVQCDVTKEADIKVLLSLYAFLMFDQGSKLVGLM